MNYWEILGIEATDDKKAIKRAYSKKLKTTRPDDDAEAYQALREAYDWSIKYGANYYSESELETDEEVDCSDGASSVDQDDNSDDYQRSNMSESQLWATSEKVETHYKAAQDAVDELFLLNSEDGMIDLFDSWLVTGELVNLKIRDAFSDLCFERAIRLNEVDSPEHSTNTMYPVRLYRHMAHEFEWLTALQSDYYKAANQETLQLRLNSYERYLELEHSLQQPWYADWLEGDYWRAKFLLGPLRAVFFFIVSYIGIFNFLVRREVVNMQNARAYGVIPEIETESFIWWESFLSRPRFSMLHFFYGAFFAQALYFEPLVASFFGLQGWPLIVLCVAICTLSIYSLTLLHFKLSQASTYSNNVQYFWYGLLLGLMCLIILFDDVVSHTVLGIGFLISAWKLVGLVGYSHLVFVAIVSGATVDFLGLDRMDSWKSILALVIVTNYFVFNLLLPYLPRWLISATTKTGIPHIVLVSVMSSISLYIISHLLQHL